MKMIPLYVVCYTAIMLQTADAFDSQGESKIRFNEQVRPILSKYCFACHGPDSGSRKADLRLDLREPAIESGAVTPGSLIDSELIERINSDDAELVMPPPEFQKKLKSEEKKLLSRWIDSGAAWQNHWAFIKPIRPEVPQPKGMKSWAKNPIDHFVLEKIHQLKLKPNEPSNRYTLARRAAFDATGLPPTSEILEAFVADSDRNAYSRYIDKLLGSKHAGEHRARYWLDAARYGDTHGMHVDNYREIWPYRDWVINAFNSNMPFDQFVIEQIAGDLLPAATLDQRIATGFSRCNITTSEGGAIPAELEVRYMVDRVETTATVFLGLTAGCAVCHDHKFDPISMREFYQLGAFFNNTTQPAMDGNQKDTPPVITLPRDEFKEEWEAIRKTRMQLSDRLEKSDSQVSQWWMKHPGEFKHPIAKDKLILSLPLSKNELAEVADLQDDGTIKFQQVTVPQKLPKNAVWAGNHPAGERGILFGEGGEFTVNLPQLRTDEPLTVSFWVKTPDRLLSTVLFDQTTKTKEKKNVGWKITSSTQGALTFEMSDHGGKKIRGLLPGESALQPRSWQHVCVRYSGGQSNSSISIIVNGQDGVLRNSSEDLIDATDLAEVPLKVATRLPTAALSDIRIYRRWVSNEEIDVLKQDYVLKKILSQKKNWKELNPQQRKLVAGYYHTAIDRAYRTCLSELSQTEQRRDFIYSRSTTTLVMQERATAPRAWILKRGEYDKQLEEVAPDVPDVLKLDKLDSRIKNRLELARWLVHPDHPLTARVMVNRLWQSVFGYGLVKTSEDFGVMGEFPSHPELLDWLAVEFVESGWDVNHIMKLILTSATYQQSSRATKDKILADRDNRYFARGPRLRLDAEVLRDQVLAVSGLLRRDMGGPSVKPYQPAGLWKVVAITGSNTRFFKRDTGDALYRRGIYTFWKRTSPPPSLAAFNAPTREQCTVRRERTNTPIQALVLMNDPQYIEAARHLAENAVQQEKEVKARAKWMLKTALCKPASKIDVAEIVATTKELHAMFQKKPEAAKKLINTGDSVPQNAINETELAVWTMIANILMNRDDFINK